MKSSTSKLFLITLFLFVIFPLSPSRTANAAMTCSIAVRKITPCINYLRSGVAQPTTSCCAGVRSLAASTTADKQTTCNCLKSASRNMKINPSVSAALPGNCGVSLGFNIDPNMDCSRIG